MNFINRLDGVQVINPRIHTNFVNNDNPSSLGLLLEGFNRWGHVACGNDIDSLVNRHSDDISMVHVWDQ